MENAGQPLIWKAVKRMVKFALILAVLTITAPLALPFAAWSVSGEDE